MAGRGDIQAGRAFVELFVKDTAFNRGLAIAQARLKSFESGLKQMSERFTILGRGISLFGLALAGGLGAAIAKLSATRTELAPLAASWGNVSQAVADLVVAIASALTPALVGVMSNVAQLVGSLTAWINANPQIVTQVAQVVASVTAGGMALVGLAVAFKIAAAAAGVLATAVGLLSAAPVTLLAIGGAGLAVAANWTSAFATLRAGFDELVTTAQTTFTGISASIAAGDLPGAVTIAWTGIKLAWLQGTDAVLTLWDSFTTTILNVFSAMSGNVARTFFNVLANISDAIQTFFDFIQPLFDALGVETVRGWEEAANHARYLAEKSTTSSDQAMQDRLAAQERRAAEREAAIAALKSQLESRTSAAVGTAAKPLTTTLNQALDQAALMAALGVGVFGGGLGGQGEISGLTTQIPKDQGTVGTFSAAAALALGGGSPQDRAAKAAEESSKKLGDLNNKVEKTNDLLAVAGKFA